MRTSSISPLKKLGNPAVLARRMSSPLSRIEYVLATVASWLPLINRRYVPGLYVTATWYHELEYQVDVVPVGLGFGPPTSIRPSGPVCVALAMPTPFGYPLLN